MGMEEKMTLQIVWMVGLQRATLEARRKIGHAVTDLQKRKDEQRLLQ